MTNVTTVNVKVIVGDGSEVVCTKRGDILTSDGTHKMLLKRVLYAPSFHKNIVSVGLFVSNNQYQVKMNTKTLTIHNKNGSELTFNREGSGVLYYFKGHRVPRVLPTTEATYASTVMSRRNECVNVGETKIDNGTNGLIASEKSLADVVTNSNETPVKTTTDSATSGTPKKMDINYAHGIYGHIGEAALRSMLKTINVEATGSLLACKGCALAKAKAKAKGVPKLATTVATYAGERIYDNISGP